MAKHNSNQFLKSDLWKGADPKYQVIDQVLLQFAYISWSWLELSALKIAIFANANLEFLDEFF